MKISKRQLKRIIKEEKRKLLNEQSAPQQPLEELEAALWQIKESHYKMYYGDDEGEIQTEIASIIRRRSRRLYGREPTLQREILK